MKKSKQKRKKLQIVFFCTFAAMILAGLFLFFAYKIHNDKANARLVEMKPKLIQTVTEGITRPVAIVKGRNNLFYVTDFTESTILIYDTTFKLIKKFGGNGFEPGKLFAPHSVDIGPDGNLYVNDYGNLRIQKFTPDGDFISILNLTHPISGSSSAYFDKDFNLYVSDYGSNSLKKYAADGQFLGWIGAREDGTLTNGWEIAGEPAKSDLPGGFDRLHATKVDNDGMIYVADTHNNRIQRFTNDGKFAGWIGAREDGTLTDGWEMHGKATGSNQPSGFNAPVAIDFTKRGNIAILGYGASRIQLFSKEGKFLGWYGGTTSGSYTNGWEKEGQSIWGPQKGAVSFPYDLRIYGDTLYIADTNNRRIEIIEFAKY